MTTIRDRAADKAFEGRRMFRDAEQDGRELSRRERAKAEELLDQAEELHRQARANESMSEQLKILEVGGSRDTVLMSDPNVRHGGERVGDAFVKSQGYAQIKDSAARPSNWSSGPIEIKATLLEGDLDTPGEGAALAQPDVRAGCVSMTCATPSGRRWRRRACRCGPCRNGSATATSRRRWSTRTTKPPRRSASWSSARSADRLQPRRGCPSSRTHRSPLLRLVRRSRLG
jgi:hypothetical protein